MSFAALITNNVGESRQCDCSLRNGRIAFGNHAGFNIKGAVAVDGLPDTRHCADCAVQTHRRQHKGRTFRQERLREIEKKSDAAETRQFSFAYVDALVHASRLVRNGIEFHLKPCTDRVAATTPFAVAEGDFLNPAEGNASN
jgi:hypothetical protein